MKKNTQIIFLLLIILTVSNSAIAQVKTEDRPNSNYQIRKLTVSGTGVEKIPSSLAQIQIGVEAQGATANEVQKEVSKRSNSVTTFLKSKQVDKLQTTGFNLNPRYQYTNGAQKMIGYQASNRVSFQVPVQETGAIMDEVVKAGATQIDSIIFSASEIEINEARKSAIRKANTDAKEQASVVLENLGFSIKEIINIQVNNTETNYPRPVNVSMSEFSEMADVGASTPIEAGEQAIRANVTFEISY